MKGTLDFDSPKYLSCGCYSEHVVMVTARQDIQNISDLRVLLAEDSRRTVFLKC